MCDLCVSDTIIVRFSCALVHQLLEVHRIEFCSNLPVCALSCAPRPTFVHGTCAVHTAPISYPEPAFPGNAGFGWLWVRDY